MSSQIQLRRGTTNQHSTFTGAVGEVTVDTDKNTVVVHDGATVGGTPLQSALNQVLTLPQINDASSDHQYIYAVAELTADRTVTLPLLPGNDEWTFNAMTQTLTNKTLGSPTITGTATGPSGTWDSGGMDLASGDTYAIDGTDVLSATTLASLVVNSNLTNVGTLTTLTVDNITINGAVITSDTAAISFNDENLTTTGTLAAGATTLTTSAAGTLLTLTSTEAGTTSGPDLELYRNSASPADNDVIGKIFFYGEDDNDAKIEYASIRTQIFDVRNATSDGKLTIDVLINASAIEMLTIQGTGNAAVVINDSGNNVDFRVESDADVNAFTVDAGTGLLGMSSTLAATNTVTDLLNLKSESTGTPAAGIGVGLTFSTETAAGNVEIGGAIRSVTTDVDPTNEDFDLVFSTMLSGDTAAEVFRINSAGRLYIGDTANNTVGGAGSRLQVTGLSAANANITVARWEASTGGPRIQLSKARNAGVGGFTAVQPGDELGRIVWFGADGTDSDTLTAKIEVEAEGTIGTGRVPTTMKFYTGTDAASTVQTLRMEIDSAGTISALGANAQSMNFKTKVTGSGAMTSGATVTLTGAIPAGALVLGISARVTTEITGPSSWLLGLSGDTNQFGDLLALASGTTVDLTDYTGAATTFPIIAGTAAIDILITRGSASDFTAGVVSVTVHYIDTTAATS